MLLARVFPSYDRYTVGVPEGELAKYLTAMRLAGSIAISCPWAYRTSYSLLCAPVPSVSMMSLLVSKRRVSVGVMASGTS
jgi:hypothetical protein